MKSIISAVFILSVLSLPAQSAFFGLVKDLVTHTTNTSEVVATDVVEGVVKVPSIISLNLPSFSKSSEGAQISPTVTTSNPKPPSDVNPSPTPPVAAPPADPIQTPNAPTVSTPESSPPIPPAGAAANNPTQPVENIRKPPVVPPAN